MDVIIVCHTEHGRVSGREVVYDQAAEGVTCGVRKLAAIADRHGAKVTFAVMPEAVDRFPQGVDHEVGLHVHPGREERGGGVQIGDRFLRDRCRTSGTSTVLRDYSYEEQRALIRAGKERLAEALGVVPKVFVAGRWSVNGDTVRALVDEGFTHDCSAVPHKRPAHYDWSRLPRICMPYRPDRDDYQRRGDVPLLIVPVSQSLFGASATPELAPLVGLPWLKACFDEYYRQGMPLFHIYVHSPAITGRYFRRAMDGLLRHIAAHDVAFRFASEVPEYRGVRPKADVLPYAAGVNRDMLGACPTLARRALAGRRAHA